MLIRMSEHSKNHARPVNQGQCYELSFQGFTIYVCVPQFDFYKYVKTEGYVAYIANMGIDMYIKS